MLRKLLCLIFFTLLSGCGGSGGDTTASPVVVTPPVVVEPVDNSLTDVVIPSGFDWSMNDEVSINFKVVSTITMIDQSGAGIGGKHFIKVTAIDQNSEQVGTTLLKALTSRTGQLESTLKFPNEWSGIKVEAKVDGVVCTETFLKNVLLGDLEIKCPVEVNAEEG